MITDQNPPDGKHTPRKPIVEVRRRQRPKRIRGQNPAGLWTQKKKKKKKKKNMTAQLGGIIGTSASNKTSRHSCLLVAGGEARRLTFAISLPIPFPLMQSCFDGHLRAGACCGRRCSTTGASPDALQKMLNRLPARVAILCAAQYLNWSTGSC